MKTFEKDFQKLSGAKVVCFDGNVNFRFWFIRFCKDLIDLVLLNKKSLEDYKRFITYFNYKSFFNTKNTIHDEKIVAPINQCNHEVDKSKITDLNQILKKEEHFNFFLKVDIEQHEYRILDQIIKNQTRITGLVIEFHECDHHFEKIKKFIEELELQLVHIHINNYGIVNEFGTPTVIELTFSPQSYNTIRDKNNNKFPVNGLDQPNNKLKKDEPIIFE